MTQQPSTKLPTSTSQIRGLLKLQVEGDPHSSWEFVVSDEKTVKQYGVNLNEVNKLSGFPRTKGNSSGIGCILNSDKNIVEPCDASFHGYHEGDGYGKSFYIGSAEVRLGHDKTDEYRKFLRTAFNIDIGKTINPIPVWIDFKDNNEVYIRLRT